MTRRPVIGVITRTVEPTPGHSVAWSMRQQYVDVLVEAGAVPWLVPLLPDDSATMREIFDRLDGVFLAGGHDIDPARYGAEKHPLTGRSDGPRDAVELMLAGWAREEGTPTLAVCRGAQLLNVAAGGTLIQDVGAQWARGQKHDYFADSGEHPRDLIVHDVHLVPGTRLHAIYETDTLAVNSMHHQAIERLGAGLHATAHAPDGLIEAVETEGEQFWVGVQWHPEDLTGAHPIQRRLFAAFVVAAGAHRAGAGFGAAR